MTTRTRSGFTLIEILLVLGIMLVLVALGIGASLQVMALVHRSNSEVVMRKVEERLGRRRESIFREARNWETPVALLRTADGDKRRAETLKLKLLVKWSFPMSYAEAQANVLESQAYGWGPGYPIALAIRNRLATRTGGNGATLLNRAPLLADLGISAADDLRNQNSACLAVIFETTLGTSVDELAPSELGRYPSSTNPAAAYDYNPLIIDAWETPLTFLRYGNLDTAAGSPFAGLPAIFGPPSTLPTSATFGGSPFTFDFPTFGTYYSQVIDRAKTAFPLHYQDGQQSTVDVDDPEGTMSSDDTTLSWPGASGPWLGMGTVPNANAFRLMFGYRLPVVDVSSPARNAGQVRRLYAPLVILSAGGDRNFQTWDDNLDSYRLTARVGNQQ